MKSMIDKYNVEFQEKYPNYFVSKIIDDTLVVRCKKCSNSMDVNVKDIDTLEKDCMHCISDKYMERIKSKFIGTTYHFDRLEGRPAQDGLKCTGCEYEESCGKVRDRFCLLSSLVYYSCECGFSYKTDLVYVENGSLGKCKTCINRDTFIKFKRNLSRFNMTVNKLDLDEGSVECTCTVCGNTNTVELDSIDFNDFTGAECPSCRAYERAMNKIVTYESYISSGLNKAKVITRFTKGGRMECLDIFKGVFDYKPLTNPDLFLGTTNSTFNRKAREGKEVACIEFFDKLYKIQETVDRLALEKQDSLKYEYDWDLDYCKVEVSDRFKDKDIDFGSQVLASYINLFVKSLEKIRKDSGDRKFGTALNLPSSINLLDKCIDGLQVLVKEQVEYSNNKLQQLTGIATSKLLVIVNIDLINNKAQLLDMDGNSVNYKYTKGNWEID